MSTNFADLILRDITANRPAAGKPGRLFFDSTLGKMQRDNGSSWDDVEGTNITALLTTFALTGDISPAQITSNQNDYDPTGLSTASILRLNSDASRDITGLAGGADGRTVAIHNVGANNIVLKDESVSSSAANRFALTADVTLSPDMAVILQYDATSSRWRVTGGSSGGGGAPTTSKYIVAASDGSLSNEIVIPGMAASGDIAGAGGAGVAHEFDSGGSPLTWSAAVDVENVHSTVLSHLYVEDNGASATIGTFAWAPAGAFDIRCKMSLGAELGTSAANPGAGLLVGDSALNNYVLAHFTFDGTSDLYRVGAYTFASSTLTQRGALPTVGVNSIYLRIVRDGSNNNSIYFSADGITWLLIATQALTYTAAKAGIRLNAASVVTKMAIDWIRANV